MRPDGTNVRAVRRITPEAEGQIVGSGEAERFGPAPGRFEVPASDAPECGSCTHRVGVGRRPADQTGVTRALR